MRIIEFIKGLFEKSAENLAEDYENTTKDNETMVKTTIPTKDEFNKVENTSKIEAKNGERLKISKLYKQKITKE